MTQSEWFTSTLLEDNPELPQQVPEGKIYRTSILNIGKNLKSRKEHYHLLLDLKETFSHKATVQKHDRFSCVHFLAGKYYQFKVLPCVLSFVLKLIIKSDICNKDTLWAPMNTIV